MISKEIQTEEKYKDMGSKEIQTKEEYKYEVMISPTCDLSQRWRLAPLPCKYNNLNSCIFTRVMCPVNTVNLENADSNRISREDRS